MNPTIARFGQAVLAGELLDRRQAETLVAAANGDELYDLFYWANRVRLKRFGRSVAFCSIAAGKVGQCSEDCRFCAQSARHATGVVPARMSDDDLVRSAMDAAGRGAESFGVVNSGRGPTDADLDWLAGPLGQIAASGRVRTCAGLGCLTESQARRLRDMGVRRYNHNLETSRRHYPNIVTTHSFDERIATLRNAKAAGLGLCSGGIFNLGEDWADRIDMALTLREIGVEVVPLNFLNPIAGTPMADRPAMHPMEVLKVVAVYRLLLPDTHLKLAGGREVNLRDLQSWMFYCGASSCMVGNYLTTRGRPADDDRQMVRDLGLTWTEYPPV